MTASQAKLESHWRLLFPSDYLAAASFRGMDVTLTIKSVSVKELQLPGRDEKKQGVILTFEETTKKIVLNKTNATTIAKLYGAFTAAWIGKPVTFFPTTCRVGKDPKVECIRVRSKVGERGEVNFADPPPVDEPADEPKEQAS
jgi:hypothetical protein